jgi:hypothetical protein
MTKENKRLLEHVWTVTAIVFCMATFVWAIAGVCFVTEGSLPQRAYVSLFMATFFLFISLTGAITASVFAIVETLYKRSRQRYKEKCYRIGKRFRIA